MVRRTVLQWVIGFLFPILVNPWAAAADPILVTAGELLVGERIGSLELTGERGFSLSARVDTALGVFNPRLQCGDGCAPDTEVSLRAFWSGFDVRDGILTFEGETYPVRDIDGASVSVEFSGTFVTPPLAPSAVVTAPFTLVPFALATGGSEFSLPFPGASLVPLRGSGIATITLSPDAAGSPDGWRVDSVRYAFTAAEPVPEPATMALVGLGIAGIARRAVRSRRASG